MLIGLVLMNYMYFDHHYKLLGRPTICLKTWGVEVEKINLNSMGVSFDILIGISTDIKTEKCLSLRTFLVEYNDGVPGNTSPHYWPFVWGQSIGHELWYFLWCPPEQAVEQTVELSVMRAVVSIWSNYKSITVPPFCCTARGFVGTCE